MEDITTWRILKKSGRWDPVSQEIETSFVRDFKEEREALKFLKENPDCVLRILTDSAYMRRRMSS